MMVMNTCKLYFVYLIYFHAYEMSDLMSLFTLIVHLFLKTQIKEFKCWPKIDMFYKYIFENLLSIIKNEHEKFIL